LKIARISKKMAENGGRRKVGRKRLEEMKRTSSILLLSNRQSTIINLQHDLLPSNTTSKKPPFTLHSTINPIHSDNKAKKTSNHLQIARMKFSICQRRLKVN
jgi:hypothetical protein